MKVEDVLTEHDNVAEAAVVGYPHEVKGEGVYAYVILKQGVNLDEESIRNELKLLVKSKISGKQSDNNNIIKLTFYEI